MVSQQKAHANGNDLTETLLGGAAMQCNVGRIDQAIRIIIGVVLLLV
jgi:hypothetical protein